MKSLSLISRNSGQDLNPDLRNVNLEYWSLDTDVQLKLLLLLLLLLIEMKWRIVTNKFNLINDGK